MSCKEYNKGGIRLIDFLEAYECDFTRGTAIKHIIRSLSNDSEGRALEELEKARFYLEEKIKFLRPLNTS